MNPNGNQSIEQEIQNLQQFQYQQINTMNNNNNNNKNNQNQNIYINDNPSLNGYHPPNGRHIERTKQLQHPSSFVPGNLAHDMNAIGSYMSLPYDHGGNINRSNNSNNSRSINNNNNNQNYRTNLVNGQYLELVGDGVW